MTRRRFIKTAVALAAIHLVVALGSLSFGYGMGMRRFDTGGDEGIVEAVLNFLGHYLLIPGAYLWTPGMSSPVQLIITLGNSVLWGALGAVIVAGICAARERNAAF